MRVIRKMRRFELIIEIYGKVHYVETAATIFLFEREEEGSQREIKKRKKAKEKVYRYSTTTQKNS